MLTCSSWLPRPEWGSYQGPPYWLRPQTHCTPREWGRWNTCEGTHSVPRHRPAEDNQQQLSVHFLFPLFQLTSESLLLVRPHLEKSWSWQLIKQIKESSNRSFLIFLTSKFKLPMVDYSTICLALNNGQQVWSAWGDRQASPVGFNWYFTIPNYNHHKI